MSSHQKKVQEQFNRLADDYDAIKQQNPYYLKELKSVFLDKVKPDSSVLEIGCGTGSILAGLKPRKGVGIDISPRMIKIAKSRHQEFLFVCSSIEGLDIRKIKYKFDYILMPDVIEYINDFRSAFSNIRKLCKKNTIIIITSANAVWTPALAIAEKLKLKMQDSLRKWPSKREVEAVLEKNGFCIGEYYTRLLLPNPAKARQEGFINRILTSVNGKFYKFPLMGRLGLIMVFVVKVK